MSRPKVCQVHKMLHWPDTNEYELCGNPALWEDEEGNLFCAGCMLIFSEKGVKFKNLEEN